ECLLFDPKTAPGTRYDQNRFSQVDQVRTDIEFGCVLDTRITQCESRKMRGHDVKKLMPPPDHANMLKSNGSERNRFPVAAKMAFPIAGAIGGTPGSPIPEGLSLDCTICTSTFGISRMRVGS